MMRVKQVLQHLDEGFFELAAGFVTGLMMPTTSFGSALALIVTAANYANLVKLAPAHRNKVVLTATTQAELTAQQKNVKHLIDKMSYKLDKMETVGTYGRKWTLSAK
jgi:hypothetical protein